MVDNYQMDKELETLVDRTRVIETINQLFIGTDNRDCALVRSVFAPSVLSQTWRCRGRAKSGA